MKHYLLLAAAAFIGAASLHAQIVLSNGTGGGDFQTGSTWQGGVAPASGTGKSWTILSGDTVVLQQAAANTYYTILGNAVGTVSGKLDLGPGGSNRTEITLGSTASGGSNGSLLVNGGTIDGKGTARLLWANTRSGSLEISSGTITNLNRISINDSNTTSDSAPSFHMSGGTINLNASGGGGFTLYDGAAGGPQASFTITGNAGVFNNTQALNLARNGSAGTGANIRFNFGSAAGAGAVTVARGNNLTLMDNQFTLDFTNIVRPANATSYSTVLLDYDFSLNGSFTAANLSSIGLNAGESASLFHDTTNKLIRVDYTLVPEPAAFALLAGLLALGGVMWRRRRD